MSGFLALAGPPARPLDLRALDAARTILAHRGGDGEGSWRDTGIALEVQVRHVDGLAGRDESQPAVDESARTALVADVRLDNREELAGAMRIADLDALSDAQLILRAWRAFGTDCVKRLEGDFAFALWDGSRRTLFAARDALGARPLVFHRSPAGLACASEIKALLQLPWVPRDIDRVRIGSFLEFLTDDPRRTFFAGIGRLAPGHWMEWDGERLRVERYHAFDAARRLPPRKGDEYAEAFGERFRAAVNARLRGTPPVACLLSGGLDTSSIVATARELTGQEPIDAYSAVFDASPECDERSEMAPVVALGGIRHHLFHAERVSPFAEWERILWYQDEALFGANFYLDWGLYRLAAADGQRVVLDGWGGDSAVGYGFERLPYLALRGRWWTLAREIRSLARRVERSERKLLRHMVLRPLRARLLPSPRQVSEPCFAPTTRPEFARENGLAERVLARDRRRARPPLSSHEAWHQEFDGARFADSFEALDRAARSHGLEPRYPFLDRRLLELCAALPEDERLRDGWPRSVQRRALAGSLPEATRTRAWKTDLGASFVHGLLTHEEERLRAMLDRPGPLDEFVDRAILGKILTRLRSQGRPDDAMEVSKCACLGLWLEAVANGSIGAVRE